MSTGAIVGIIIAVLIVAAIVVLGPALLRKSRMRRQFGPEYDRLAKELGSRKAAAELAARQQRVDALGIHPLSAEQQTRYAGEWATVQQQFVEAPAAAVSAADTLVWDVMRDRGYPVEDKDASMEALSVYHARPLDGYRQTQDIRAESASTEDLRTTLIRHRTLFQDLVGVQASHASLQGRAAVTARPVAASKAESDAEAVAETGGGARRIATVPPKTADTPR
jgi:hypothetical protein